MPRRRKTVEEPRNVRTVRTVIWMTEENYARWKSMFPLLGVKNMEVALVKLLDLYELASKLTGKRKIDEVIEELKKQLGEVRLRVVEKS